MENKELKKSPFFAQLLEKQIENTEEVNGGADQSTTAAPTGKYPSDKDEAVTLKYPSDNDEETTMKYPSDFDEK